VPHGGPEPHWQSPTVQLSAVSMLHVTHAEPRAPQALVERALQVGPEQQPVTHVDVHPVHAPFAQLSPLGHIAHELPPLPQAPSVLPPSQAPFAQQPVGQEVPSQVHVPLRQCWPDMH
jgi:hypothetical protein